MSNITPLISDDSKAYYEGGDGKPAFCECKEGDESMPSCHYQKFVTRTGGGKMYNQKVTRMQRIQFIKKVYSILLGMVCSTTLIVILVLNLKFMRGCKYEGPLYEDKCDLDGDGVPDDDQYIGFVSQTWPYFTAVGIIALMVLICGTSGATDDMVGVPLHMIVPYNYILLTIFVVCISVGGLSKIVLACQQTQVNLAIQAYCLTCAAVLGITIYAFTGFRDLPGAQEISFMGPALSAIGLVFGSTIFFVVAPNDKLGCHQEVDEAGDFRCKEDPQKIFFALIGVVGFTLIMLLDTSMIIGNGGESKGFTFMFTLGPECYILGAIQLYLETINMFILILVILSDCASK